VRDPDDAGSTRRSIVTAADTNKPVRHLKRVMPA
jgi:hypothetical protein